MLAIDDCASLPHARTLQPMPAVRGSDSFGLPLGFALLPSGRGRVQSGCAARGPDAAIAFQGYAGGLQASHRSARRRPWELYAEEFGGREPHTCLDT